MRIGTGLLIHFRGTGIVVKKKRERREEGAEIGRRWRRGNGANRVDKSRMWRGKKKTRQRGERRKGNGNGEMEWKSKLKAGERWREHGGHAGRRLWKRL